MDNNKFLKVNTELYNQGIHKLSYIRDKLLKVDEYLMKTLLSDAICLFLDSIDKEEKQNESKKW